MFLSKRSNGVYYLWFIDESGKKRKVSTGCYLKSEALKFLQEFNQSQETRKVQFKNIPLSQFKQGFLQYSQTVHRSNTQRLFRIALTEFSRIISDIPLQNIGFRDIEHF